MPRPQFGGSETPGRDMAAGCTHGESCYREREKSRGGQGLRCSPADGERTPGTARTQQGQGDCRPGRLQTPLPEI